VLSFQRPCKSFYFVAAILASNINLLVDMLSPHTMAVSRDVYKTDIDFAALALQYPDFAKK
jgi:hypothetical protein